MIGYFNRASIHMHMQRTRGPFLCLLAVNCTFSLVLWADAPICYGVTPESREVRELVDKGLKYLEANTDERLGGRCLIALAFLKNGASPDHPRIKEAIAACEATSAEQLRGDSVYSNGLAIIFLAELDPVKYKSLIERFAGVMQNRQKSNGGWGYDAYQTGDTSQTQYAVLAFWELMQVGLPPKVETVENGANWLLRTQDPGGAWGYQGKDPGSFKLEAQNDITVSMLAAGLGSTLICANILGTLEPGQAQEVEAKPKEQLPSALKVAESSKVTKIKTLSGGNLDREQVIKATTAGKAWFDKNFNKDIEADYPYYMLYSVERYKSFEDFLAGNIDEEPSWYEIGVNFIKENQKADGSVTSIAGPECATAFAILFLVRSTQQSIKASLGEGTLVGGRGLSANLARMKIQKGRLVKESKPTEIDNFLALLDATAGPELDSLLSESSRIDVSNISLEEIRRLQQLVKSGAPEVRLMAVEALSQLRSLDYVPSLLYALTDPDKRVVRSARDGLQFVSRRFKGYGPSDNFTDKERYDSLELWKNWYQRVRPNAPVAP